MECCKILLSFFLHFGETEGKLNFGYVEKVPHSASLIVNLSMKHYKERFVYNILNISNIENAKTNPEKYFSTDIFLNYF